MWNDTWIHLLRAEINDIDSESYSDDRLLEVLIVAAYQVRQAINFTNTYTINICEQTISPDPVESNDYDFSVLAVYKAACIVLNGEAKKASTDAIMIKDGPSVLDTRTSANNLSKAAENACKTYMDLLNEFRFIGSLSDDNVLGQAVLTPYSPGSFLYSWQHKDQR